MRSREYSRDTPAGGHSSLRVLWAAGGTAVSQAQGGRRVECTVILKYRGNISPKYALHILMMKRLLC